MPLHSDDQLPLPFHFAREVSPSNEWCQRWGPGRRHSWRHVSEGGFDTRQYEVAEVDERTAKRYIVENHYSGRYVAARMRWGLYQANALVGVAVLSVPVRKEVLTNVLPDLQPYEESLELGRLVLADRVPANGESWFLARVFRAAYDRGLRGVVSFADPVARRDVDGRTVFGGHVGICYQALGASFRGRACGRLVHLLPDGSILNERAVSKVRNGERGQEYVEHLLRRFGAPPRRLSEPGQRYLQRAFAAVPLRTLRHGGSYRYVFALGRTARERALIRVVGSPGRYPKQLADDPTIEARRRGA